MHVPVVPFMTSRTLSMHTFMTSRTLSMHTFMEPLKGTLNTVQWLLNAYNCYQRLHEIISLYLFIFFATIYPDNLIFIQRLYSCPWSFCSMGNYGFEPGTIALIAWSATIEPLVHFRLKCVFAFCPFYYILHTVYTCIVNWFSFLLHNIQPN